MKSLGTVRGFTPWDYLDLIKSGKIKVQESNNFNSLIQKALMKRVEGAYINIAVGRHHLAKEMKKPGALVFDPGLPHTKSEYKLSTINHPEVLGEFNQFMKENKALVDRLKAKYRLRD